MIPSGKGQLLLGLSRSASTTCATANAQPYNLKKNTVFKILFDARVSPKQLLSRKVYHENMTKVYRLRR
jgi:hypothetical protein